MDTANETSLARLGGRRTLPNHHQRLAAVRLLPREVMVIVDALGYLRREQADNSVDDPVPTGVGVRASNLHRRPVVLTQGSVERQQRRGCIHRIVHPRAPLLSCCECEEAGAGLVAEPAAAEVNADPERAVGPVLEQIDVVVPAAHRPELIARYLKHRPLFAHGTLRDSFKDRVVVDPFRVRPAEAERDHLPDLVHHAAHVDVSRDEIRPHRAVSTRDVVADAVRRDMMAVADDAAHGHRIPQMVVRTEHAHGAGLGLKTSCQLRARAIVGFTKHNCVSHDLTASLTRHTHEAKGVHPENSSSGRGSRRPSGLRHGTQNRNRTSPITPRLIKSPKTCCCSVRLNTLVARTATVIVPSADRTPAPALTTV